MPLREVLVSFARDYDFGIGVDFASGSPMARVVDGTPSTVRQASGAGVDMSVSRITTSADLEQSLGIDVDASAGSGLFGASAEAAFHFAQEVGVQTTSLFMAVTINLELAFLSINDPALTPDASSLVDRPDVFASRFGNMFVRGISRGGAFVGVLKIDTTSTQDQESIAAELNGSYGLFSADAKTKFQEVSTKFRSEVSIHMFHLGGPVDLQIKDPQDPMELLNNANLFLQSFQDQPDAVAVPFQATLAPISIAKGPLPPNEADILKAQDVLVFCGRRRSALLDQLNLLQFIVDHPDRYDFTQGASLQTVAAAASGTQSDLDLIGDCASAAINHPSEAKLPADFAAERHTTFPMGVPPDPLPPLKPGTPQPVEVPDFVNYSPDDHYEAGILRLAQDFASSLGLQLAVIVQNPDATPDDAKVTGGLIVSQSPPAGTKVAPGSTVSVTVFIN